MAKQQKKEKDCKRSHHVNNRRISHKNPMGRRKMMKKISPKDLCDRKLHKDGNLNEWDLASFPLLETFGRPETTRVQGKTLVNSGTPSAHKSSVQHS